MAVNFLIKFFFISLKYYNSWTKLLGRRYRVPSSSEVVETQWSQILFEFVFKYHTISRYFCFSTFISKFTKRS